MDTTDWLSLLSSCASSVGRHSWSATQQHHHLQSAAWTRHQPALSMDRNRHRLWLSTGRQVRVNLTTYLPVGTDDRKGIWPIKYRVQLSSKVLLRELGPSRSANLKRKPKQASRKKQTVKCRWAMYSCSGDTSMQCTLTRHVGRKCLLTSVSRNSN